MCGICGFTGAPDEAILKKMTSSVIHRGPDDDGFYVSDGINLGMRRLSIIDLATGKQPIHNEDKTLWVVFNGEIYNFAELRGTLKNRGHRFYTDHSDTEVIVHLYEEYGEDFPNHINGMFAIALWDTKRNKLLLVRDRMGVKPLFYSERGGRLIFGSEIKAILEHPACIKAPNHTAIYHYLTLKHIPSPLTAFDGIRSLGPAEMAAFESGGLSVSSWWEPHFAEDTALSEETISERIVSILEDGTRIRMISDVPFGAYLSGGVDSSAVVALMSRFTQVPIKTFTLGYEDELENKAADIHFARKVSRQFRTDHYEYIMTADELATDLGSVIRAFDQPFSGTISTFFLSKLMSQHVKVAISGDGADELFGSYLSHRAAQPMWHMKKLYRKVKANTLTSEERGLLEPCTLDFLQKLYEYSDGDEALWRMRLLLLSDGDKAPFMSQEMRERVSDASTLALIRQYYARTGSRDPLNRVLEMEWRTFFPDQVLAFVDFLSMAHSVEVRSPFLDYRLVEFCATIPGGQKIKAGVVKHILKRSVKSLLPEGIIDRPKEGFVLPIFDWMVDKLKSHCNELLAKDRVERFGLLNPEKVAGLIEGYYAGDRSKAGVVWNMMMLQLWCECYLE